VAEAVQVLRENPNMFDIVEAYDLVAMNETPDEGVDNGMADMDRQLWEEGYDIEAGDDVLELEEIPKEDDMPPALPRDQIDSSDNESTGSGVPELVPCSNSPLP
jgi:hypothetical protein